MGKSELRRYAPPVIDIVIAAALVAMGSVLAIGNARIFEEVVGKYNGPEDAAILASVAVAVAPVAFRRVFPLGTLVAITAGMLLMAIYGVIEITATNVSSFVALVSAGIYGRDGYRDWVRGLFAVGVITIFVALFISRSGFDTMNISPRLMVGVALAEFAANAGFVGLGWYMGDTERRRRAVDAELAEKNRELQAALQKVDRQAANEERLAIARDVHDVVGHTVSLLGVQAAAARRQVGRDPKAAEDMLKTMEGQSRTAVDEIRGLIAVLRDPVEGRQANKAPTPSFDQLDELIEQVRSTGTDVSYNRYGSTPISAGLGLSVYRVVQEALSNAIRHGDGGIEVVIDSGGDAVQLFVSNDMVRGDGIDSASSRNGGSGLPGIAERVGLHGGAMKAGRNGAGRFELSAVMPNTAVASAGVAKEVL